MATMTDARSLTVNLISLVVKEDEFSKVRLVTFPTTDEGLKAFGDEQLDIYWEATSEEAPINYDYEFVREFEPAREQELKFAQERLPKLMEIYEVFHHWVRVRDEDGYPSAN
jgi:hypothetical protein